MNTEQERAKFEWWASDEGEYPQAVERAGECYKLAQIQSYWIAWQARAALAQEDREDAERYRWLRENWFTMGSTYKDDQIQFYINGPRYSNATEAKLDEAIDHARRVEGERE